MDDDDEPIITPLIPRPQREYMLVPLERYRRLRRSLWMLAACLAVLGVVAVCQYAWPYPLDSIPPEPCEEDEYRGPVYWEGSIVGVVDGDTFIFEREVRTERVVTESCPAVKLEPGDIIIDVARTRYKIDVWGIDAPQPLQPHGKQAKKALSDLLLGYRLKNSDGRIEAYWRGRGASGRLRWTVRCEIMDVGEAMVTSGHAWVDRTDSDALHAPYTAQAGPVALKNEKMARDYKLGLWSLSNPLPPWEWRRRYMTQHEEQR